jgi:hypothetical protein
LLFSPIKMKRFDEILVTTQTSRPLPALTLSREQALACAEAQECDFTGTRTLFGQASRTLASAGAHVFRTRGEADRGGRAFVIKFENENGTDWGGLYRDWLEECAKELMSSTLPLFVPTPNTKENIGDNRDAWTLNPAPLTRDTTRMLIFLGQLMGLCIRKGDILPIALSQVIWKLLVGDEPTLEDLASADISMGHVVRSLRSCSPSQAGSFSELFGDLRMMYPNSAGESTPLVDGGADIAVTFDSCIEFTERAQKMRVEEARAQVNCIRSGMATAVPVDRMALWSWRDLERRVCGEPTVDMGLLRKYAKYESVEPDAPRVKFLWGALQAFSEVELTQKVKNWVMVILQLLSLEYL